MTMTRKLTNYWLYPVLLAACLGGLVIDYQLWLMLSSLFLLIHMCCKQYSKLWIAGIACSFFVVLSTALWQEKVILNEADLAETNFSLTIQPDTIKVNGDLVTFTSRDKRTKKNISHVSL